MIVRPDYDRAPIGAPGRPAGPAGGEAMTTVLAVTSQLPWPLNTGGHLRTFHLLRAAALHYRVRLVTAAGPDDAGAIAALRDHGIEVEVAAVGPRSPWREAARALAAAGRGQPYVFYRRHDRRAVRRQLRKLVATGPAAVYLDHLDSFAFRRLLGGLPIVLDLHNVYSTIARRASAERAPGPVSLYLRREAALLRRAERSAAEGADILLTVSEDDARHFAGLGAGDVRVVPNGVDAASYADLPEGRSTPIPTLLYIGAMSWEPNARAARFLATEVLPAVRERFPGARLRVVGRDPSREVRSLGGRPGVEVTGTVADVRPYLADADVLAVPLETGGGTRLKILEAFAAGLPVVSTPVGCEGLRVRHDEHLVIAERGRFSGAVERLLDDPATGRRLAGRARALALESYDWDVIGEAARDAITDAIRCATPTTNLP
ncbi:glycosyltransferase family 4 protein [Tautonia plasticadhaerens]|uniref:GDP-mannose-dependent alpha-(1-2)-phosphatidylinositol mannosyltransferase n=1 Tax=Tautonia plasticadhaerens TaxID=2527974 RepID=A0A518HFX3_9BACT|nr:glycosyltransferase family 4 protein [Tautonia plasticadhaerens]QDV39718.1 GDP-mannose-dependent alpha-(1-2)-phosphatidylinositol mannosyltransferase [Tautonia plasticadhaerens]